MATGTPKHKVRVESEIERHREEGNWSKCIELAAHLPDSQGQLSHFLMGEAKLEKYMEETGRLFTGDDRQTDNNLLKEAKNHLNVCLNPEGGPLAMDSNLLLAKAHYISGDYSAALKYIDGSGIEVVTQVERAMPSRVMKLVAESLAVRGMCLEKTGLSGMSTEVEEKKPEYLRKAMDLSVKYLQNLEKQQGSQYMTFTLGSILETAIQKTPMLYVQNKKISQAINVYRSFMNAVENNSTLNLRQFMSRQMIETILRGVSRSVWPKFDPSLTSLTGPWKPMRYIGQSLFYPKEREEELLLLLFISEVLAARNVVLERSPEFNDTRNQSLQAVTAIYDLMTLTFVPLKFYYLDCFERAMKFSFQVKHVWFQFALTLIQTNRFPRRALEVLYEVSKMDKTDPVPLLLAAKVCIEDLDKPEQSLKLAHEALVRVKCKDALYPRICLMIGVANALIFEEGTDALRKVNQQHLSDAIKYLKLSLNANPYDHLPFMHLSLLMGHQRVIKDALEFAQAALLLNPWHLPTIQLVILCLSARKQHQEALDLCEVALHEYPDHLILLYIKSHLEQEVFEDGREQALLTAKHMLRCFKSISNDPSSQNYGFSYNTKGSYHRASLLTGANYDNLSLKMEQTLSEVTSLDSLPVIAGSAAADSFSNSSRSSTGKNKQLWNLHLHIWLLVVELYIKLDQLNEAESCIFEGVNTIFGPLSHQLMYVKGLLAKEKGKLLEAKSFLQNAISINPNHARALQQLGHVYYLIGNNLAADKYLRDSLKIDSTINETWSFMSLVLDSMGDSSQAVKCHETALQLEATSPILPFTIIPRAVFE